MPKKRFGHPRARWKTLGSGSKMWNCALFQVQFNATQQCCIFVFFFSHSENPQPRRRNHAPPVCHRRDSQLAFVQSLIPPPMPLGFCCCVVFFKKNHFAAQSNNYDDLIGMGEISEGSILHQVRMRYFQDEIYVRVPLLIFFLLSFNRPRSAPSSSP